MLERDHRPSDRYRQFVVAILGLVEFVGFDVEGSVPIEKIRTRMHAYRAIGPSWVPGAQR